MKKKTLLFLLFTILTFLMLTRVVKAQAGLRIGMSGENPLFDPKDHVTGLEPGLSFRLQPYYGLGPRLSMNVTVGYTTLNPGHGFSNQAAQYGYTEAKGFTISSHSGGVFDMGLGVGFNLLSGGTTDCGMPKPSLILGVEGGAFLKAGVFKSTAKSKDGVTMYALTQGGMNDNLYYGVNLDLLYPVSPRVAISTRAAWRNTVSDMSVYETSNGNSIQHTFRYSDLQLGIGVQVAFKGITEKGINRSVPVPVTYGTGLTGSDGVGQPQAMTTGQPIGGIVVKGGVNPGTKPGKPHAMMEGNPIPGVVIKGGVNAGLKLVYTEDMPVTSPTLLSYLGVSELVIAKGEYTFDYSNLSEAKVMLHLHKEGIVHRDLAARSFLFNGTDADGQPLTYCIEPLYVDGVAKDILVTYKGISEKGIK